MVLGIVFLDELERRRQNDVPQSLPLMDFLLVFWPEVVFADFTPTIVG